MKRVLLIVLAVLFTTGVALADPAADGAKALSVRTFQLKYKTADRATAVIKSLLSADGSMSTPTVSRGASRW